MSEFSFGRFIATWLVGAVGFAVGFYLGFFLILSVWGLDFVGFWFPVITGIAGSIVAGAAMTPTVDDVSRVRRVVTASGFGVVLVLVIGVLDADVGAMAVGGVILVTVASVMLHTSSPDTSPER